MYVCMYVCMYDFIYRPKDYVWSTISYSAELHVFKDFLLAYYRRFNII